ncbi:MAG: restriction endonuclease subunit S [Oscillospiraceae bacterium]
MEANSVALIDIIELIGGGTPKTSVPEYWNGDIPWLSVKDFNNDNRYVYETEKCITQVGLEHSSTKLLQEDDIIISARGTVGELAMIPYPMAFNQSCYGIRAKENVDNTFLYYLMKNSINRLRLITHGSVFDTITRDTFSQIEIDLPSIEKQKRIATVLSLLDDKIELNNQINKNLCLQAA